MPGTIYFIPMALLYLIAINYFVLLVCILALAYYAVRNAIKAKSILDLDVIAPALGAILYAAIVFLTVKSLIQSVNGLPLQVNTLVWNLFAFFKL